MKNRIISSIAYVVLGILLILIPTVLFPVCDSSMMKMACYYTGKAVVGIGIIVLILGVVSVLFKDKKVRLGISIAIITDTVLIYLYTFKLIGLCKNETMDCRVGTEPALLVATTILLLVALFNVIFIIVTNKNKLESKN